MRRMSSLPIVQHCPRADTIANDVETANAARSTIFHAYCESGQWPDTSSLEEVDLKEIQQWTVPTNYILERGGKEYELRYSKSVKEHRVSLDAEFNYVPTNGESPEQISKLYSSIITSGSFDMGYYFPDDGLVVVEDIKSSIFAVKARCESLQLHAYAIGYAKELGAKAYCVGIWDASQGKHYFGPVIEVDSFEYEEYCERIRQAALNTGENFIKGTHWSQCWVRTNCSAHLEGVPDTDAYRIMRAGADAGHVRLAMVEAKRLEDQSKKLFDAIKAHITQHGAIDSEDGRQQYGPIITSGRKSLDKKAVQKALGVKDLNGFNKQGKDISTFRWYNRRD